MIKQLRLGHHESMVRMTSQRVELVCSARPNRWSRPRLVYPGCVKIGLPQP